MYSIERTLVGAILGAWFAFGLAGDEISVGMTWEETKEGWSYEARALWFVVYRYPEDGDFRDLTPKEQIEAWWDFLTWGSVIIGTIGGGTLGFLSSRSPAEPESS